MLTREGPTATCSISPRRPRLVLPASSGCPLASGKGGEDEAGGEEGPAERCFGTGVTPPGTAVPVSRRRRKTTIFGRVSPAGASVTAGLSAKGKRSVGFSAGMHGGTGRFIGAGKGFRGREVKQTPVFALSF